MSNKEMMEKLQVALKNIGEVQRCCKKRCTVKLLHKAITRVLWALELLYYEEEI